MTFLMPDRKRRFYSVKERLGAVIPVEEIADKLAAPVIKALHGSAVIPDDSPLTTGGIGLLGTAPSEEALEECDSLLIIGSKMPYVEYYPNGRSLVARRTKRRSHCPHSLSR